MAIVTGASRCKQLKSQLLRRSLTVQMENAIVPGKAFKALISYHNTPVVYHKIIALDYEDWQEISGYGHDKQINQLNRKTALKEWSQKMSASDDLMPHSVELILDELEIGHYILMSSTTAKFADNGEAVVVNPFWSTNLAFTFLGSNKSESQVVVVDRFTGQGIDQAKVDIYQFIYNNSSRKNEKNLIESGITNANGEYKIIKGPTANRNNFIIEVSKGKDQFITGRRFYSNRWYNNEQQLSTQTFFFTDRSIYRPGQTVNFKAIILNSNGEKTELAGNYEQEVILKDANYQDVEDITLKTNEFGSCSGSFVLPENGLLGQFQLYSNTGSHIFRVEEYKRPKI